MTDETKPTIELRPELRNMVEVAAAELFFRMTEATTELFFQASEIAQRQMIQNANEITKERKIQVVVLLCEEGIIDPTDRDRILDALGYDQLQSVG